jgi:hypothetical protein
MSENVRVSLGVTINTGNFESARLDASYETEVRAGETVEDAFDRAWKVVDEEISEKSEPHE